MEELELVAALISAIIFLLVFIVTGYFGCTAYCRELKQNQLGVNPNTLPRRNGVDPQSLTANEVLVEQANISPSFVYSPPGQGVEEINPPTELHYSDTTPPDTIPPESTTPDTGPPGASSDTTPPSPTAPSHVPPSHTPTHVTKQPLETKDRQPVAQQPLESKDRQPPYNPAFNSDLHHLPGQAEETWSPERGITFSVPSVTNSRPMSYDSGM